MANALLYKSSLICTYLHLYMLYFYPIHDIEYVTFILFALLVSILNHGYTHRAFQITDRATMMFGLPYTYIRIRNSPYSQICLTSIPLFYLYAKYSRNVYYHVLCHALITGINIHIISNYQIK